MALTQFQEQPKGALIETSTQIQRTMVVGLGGTGGEIIKRLKRRLRRAGQASSYIRFLSLDTDVRTWLATLQFPQIDPKERVALSYPNPENVLNAPHLYPTIQHLFHQGRRVDISLLADGSGAGLMPVVGRAAFHLNAVNVYNSLQRALHDLKAMPAHPGGQPLSEEYRIYVVGSVAGGTGAGALLETAVLIRHVFSSLKFRLVGVVALPEAFAPTLRGQQLDYQSRGNAYAVLKELQYLQDGPVYWDDPETYTYQYQLGGDTRTIALNERPFHILYLVDNQNQHGGALRNLTDIYEMVAQQLSVEIGSPFGAKFASAQANDRAIMGLAPCPETQRPANISSLATAALTVPEEKLTRYCARRYLREVLRERLIGGGTQPHPTEKAASAWVMATGLEERGSHRSISRAVLTDTREEREVTGGAHALDPEAVMQKPVTEFLAALAAQEDYFTGQALPGIRAMAERNLERLRGALPEQVATMLEEAFAAGGVRGALAARAAVERELTAMSGALAGRQSEDEAVRAEVAAHLAGAREELERKAGLLGKLFGKSRELRQKLGQLQADVMQLDLDLLARTAAMRLVDAARQGLEEQRRRLEALETQLTRLQSLVEAEIAQEQWAPDTGSAYALETEVIRPEHFPAYYERFRPASPEGFLGSLTTGEGGGYLPRLCGREYAELSTLLHGAARAQFQDRVERLNVVEVLGELYDRTDAFHLLDDLARRCQPFWTASPRGAGAFSDVFLIGSPGIQPGGPSTPVQAEPLLQEWVDQHAGGSMGGLHSAPTYVALGTPGSIIFSRQTHGARLHYMRQILDYQEHYRMLQQQRGYPVHFKSCLEALPELRPDDEKATEAWALGVAYGMIALKDFGWVWALDSEQRKDHEVPGAFRTVEFLRTSSVWDIAAEIVPVEGRETQPHSSRFLHATRSGALGQFSQRREFIAAAERKVRQRLDGSGKLAVGNELTRYLEEVLGPRCRRADEMEAATMTKEYTAIRRYLDRLNL